MTSPTSSRQRDRRPFWDVLFVTASALLAIGCNPDPQQHRFRVVQRDGVLTATTASGPLFDSPPFELQEVARVKQDESIEASLLSDPHIFGPGPDNTLIVVERIEARVIVYDSDGEFIRQIGSLGSGPGQFQRIRSMQVIGDSLVFYDGGLSRLSIFNVDGRLIDTISTRYDWRQFSVDLLPQGLLAVYTIPPPADLTYMTVRLVRRANGETVASLVTGSVKREVSAEIDGVVLGSGPIPFTGEPIALAIPGPYILTSSGSKPEVDLYDIQGNLVRRISLDLRPRKVTAQMKNRYWAAEERRRALYGRTVDPREKAEKIFSESAGWWSGAVADDAGYLWMQDAVYYPLAYQPRDFFVFDPEGRYLGKVQLPSEARRNRTGLRIKGGLLFALIKDTMSGGVVPVVYRIIPTYDEIAYP